MDLFNNTNESNILPFDGETNYYGSILNSDETKHYYETLLQEIKWENDKATIFGKLIITKRKVAWYGDRPTSFCS
jgi:hypothetical protein